MPCTRSCAEGESNWTVVVPGTRWRNCEILELSEIAFTVSMVMMRRSFAGLHLTRCMRVACRAVLMLSLMAIVVVVRGEPSLLIMSLHSRMVRPFFGVAGALGVGVGAAAAGGGFAPSVNAFFLPFLSTWAHVKAASIGMAGGGGGGGGGGGAAAAAASAAAFCHICSRCRWCSVRLCSFNSRRPLLIRLTS